MADKLTTYQGQGPDGNFSIDLPAWATEATQALVLKQLDNMNKNFKDLPKDLGTAFKDALKGHAVALKDLNTQTKKQTQNQKKKTDSDKKHQSKTQKAQDALVQQMFGNAQALKDLENLTKKNAGAGGGSLLDLAGKAGPLGIAMNGLAKVTGGLLKVFGALSTAVLGVATFIGREFVKVFNLLNDSLTEGTGRLVGAFTDETVNMAGEASRAGLSVKEFGEALARNSEEIVVLGTQNFRMLRNQVMDMQGGMYDMGFSQEQITEMLGREISIRARLGVQLDQSGRDLGNNVRITAQQVRMLGNAAGINADILYDAGKQTDETNALMAARARQFGNVGINALSTSVRKLAMKITALAPTFGKEVSEPLINAMLTGAVGLDSAFTDLVTVMPGLVDVFQKGRDEIMRGGGIQESTINTMVERLADVSEQEFTRAKMLALMTRNQNALTLVNFASEARARKSLIEDIKNSGNVEATNTLNSAATIARQFEIFLDAVKAPFENAITTFVASFLGTNLSGGDKNLGDLVIAFNTQVQSLIGKLPGLGTVLDSDFFTSFNEFVETMFGEGSETEKAEARAKLNGLITNKIEELGDTLGDAFRDGVLGKVISDMFLNLIDEIAVNINEATDGRFMSDTAGRAYIRRGEIGKALAIEDKIGSETVAQHIVDQFNESINTTLANTTGGDIEDLRREIDYRNRTGIMKYNKYRIPYENNNRLGPYKDMNDEEFNLLVQRIGTYEDLVNQAAEKVGLDLATVGADSKNFFDADDLYKAAKKDITGPAAMFIQELYGSDIQNALKLIEQQGPLTVDDIRAVTLSDLNDKPQSQRTEVDNNQLAFQNNIISGVQPINQQPIAPLLDNFVNSNMFQQIIADGVVTAVEAKMLLGGKGEDQTVPDPDDPTKTITLDNYQYGLIDKEVIHQLKLTDESNKLVRDELVKFLRTLDKDSLLPKNL